MAGAVLLALHGRDDRRRCSGADRDLEGDCRFRYETVAGGATALTVGLVSIITGAALLAGLSGAGDLTAVLAALVGLVAAFALTRRLQSQRTCGLGIQASPADRTATEA